MSVTLPAATLILAIRYSFVSTMVSYTRSLDLTYLDFFLCGHMKQLVYETVVETEDHLVARITIVLVPLRTCQESSSGHDNQWSDDVLRAYRPMVAHSSSSCESTAVSRMLNYLLCKSSLASEIAVGDHMYSLWNNWWRNSWWWKVKSFEERFTPVCCYIICCLLWVQIWRRKSLFMHNSHRSLQ